MKPTFFSSYSNWTWKRDLYPRGTTKAKGKGSQMVRDDRTIGKYIKKEKFMFRTRVLFTLLLVFCFDKRGSGFTFSAWQFSLKAIYNIDAMLYMTNTRCLFGTNFNELHFIRNIVCSIVKAAADLFLLDTCHTSVCQLRAGGFKAISRLSHRF
jgi:hypothetical protein